MQFMEPLGATDGSVEASWDHLNDCWRQDLVEVTRQLGTTMVRWGGIFCDFYRWREAVGPRKKRVPMVNLQWGGIESNQVGTAEFVDFCGQVGADPLMCVNFESDGRKHYMRYKDSVRTADAREAAQWVAYCNRPDNAERIAHGHRQPLTIKHWQLGNETSYNRSGFDLNMAGAKTIEFARAMRAADPSIQLIGWGDSGWAPRMAEMAGEHLDYLAFHHMFNPDDRKQPALRDLEYRKDPDRTWHILMDAHEIHEQKIRRIRDSVAGCDIPLAMTECHFAIPGRDRCDVLSTWAAGVSYARMLNVHQRHGDVLKIATAADFCGTRWNVNAVMLPVPGRRGAYMMPVARVMSLYRHHSGKDRVEVSRSVDGLDVVASRSGDRIFVHVVNTQRAKSITTRITVAGAEVKSGRVFQIAAEPEQETTQFNPDRLGPVEKSLPPSGEWTFPAASVSAVEIEADGLA
jgi:alpha-L-arabinofuranosidase